MDITSYLLGKQAGGSAPAILEEKNVTVTTNGETTITPSEGYDGISKVNLTTLVPSSGIVLNGTIQNKIIQGGNISKGDFVKAGYEEITDRLSSANDCYEPTTSNLTNLLDNDDDTYSSINGNNTNHVFFIKSANNLNIPSGSKILDIKTETKIEKGSSTSVGSLYLTKYPQPYTTPGTLPTGTAVVVDSYSLNNIEGIQIVNFTQINPCEMFNVDASNINSIGLRLYVGANGGFKMYYVKFYIKYEYKGKIYKITSTNENAIGVANGNGTVGDTIEVYVPNTQ